MSQEGSSQVHGVFMRRGGREESFQICWREGEDRPGLHEGSETGDKGGASGEARACFHQLNCNHTV